MTNNDDSLHYKWIATQLLYRGIDTRSALDSLDARDIKWCKDPLHIASLTRAIKQATAEGDSRRARIAQEQSHKSRMAIRNGDISAIPDSGDDSDKAVATSESNIMDMGTKQVLAHKPDAVIRPMALTVNRVGQWWTDYKMAQSSECSNP